MLPHTRNLIRSQLIDAGYPSYLINRMKPWSLISSYSLILKKKNKINLNNSGNKIVWDSKSHKYIYITTKKSIYISNRRLFGSN